jgi:hypothetical protein
MRRNRINKLPVEWYLKDKKRPFAYSTTAESRCIAALLAMFGNLRDVLEAYNKKRLILSPTELFIIKTFVDNGELTPPIA